MKYLQGFFLYIEYKGNKFALEWYINNTVLVDDQVYNE